MTFNIHHGEGTDGRLDLPRVAEAINAFRPDVVGLQEVDREFGPRSRWVDQLQVLSAATGMKYSAFGANVVNTAARNNGWIGQYGNAILSKFEIIESTNHPLPTGPGLEPRGLLLARMAVEGTEFSFGTFHATANGKGEVRWEQRLREYQKILEIIRHKKHPIIVRVIPTPRLRQQKCRCSQSQDCFLMHGLLVLPPLKGSVKGSELTTHLRLNIGQ